MFLFELLMNWRCVEIRMPVFDLELWFGVPTLLALEIDEITCYVLFKLPAPPPPWELLGLSWGTDLPRMFTTGF